MNNLHINNIFYVTLQYVAYSKTWIFVILIKIKLIKVKITLNVNLKWINYKIINNNVILTLFHLACIKKKWVLGVKLNQILNNFESLKGQIKMNKLLHGHTKFLIPYHFTC